jgi:16S rRNA (guanine966-N2)-methyltransferase
MPGGRPHRGAGEVRLIGGQWRGRRLPVADRPGLRPTPDRVRQTLFDWLMHRAGGTLAGWRCVDAFAGTGALGFEAASRGAAEVLMVENDPAAVAALMAARERLSAAMVQVRRGDGLSLLRAAASGSIDLVFLDPPFASALAGPAMQAAARLVRPGGWIYLESSQPWAADAAADPGLALDRHLKAGAVHAHLLQRTEPPGAATATLAGT